MNKKLLIIAVLIGAFFNNRVFSQAFDLTLCLPANYVKDGSADYTEYLQKGLMQYSDVIFPNFPILINERGLEAKSNQTLTFLDNSQLIMAPNSKERYGLLKLTNVSNVTINNATLIGDRDKHKGDKGEWGMGIMILSSSNVVIKNPKISKFWGDGIYIGEILHDERTRFNLPEYTSKNILIKGGLLDQNRRNGISVISVRGLVIDGTEIRNTEGKAPMAGICIEPNNNEQFLEKIELRNIISKNNKEVGFKYVTSSFFGPRKKNVSIIIENCTDYGSKVGLHVGGARASHSKRKIEKFEGEILIKGFSSHSNTFPVRIGSIQNFSPRINFQNISVYSNGKRDLSKEKKVHNELKTRRFLLEKK